MASALTSENSFYRFQEKMVRFLREGNFGEYEGIRLQEHPAMQLFFSGGTRIGSPYLVEDLLEIWLRTDGELRVSTALFHEFPDYIRSSLASPFMKPGAVSEGRIEFCRKKLELAEQGVVSLMNAPDFARCCATVEQGNYNAEIRQMNAITQQVLRNTNLAVINSLNSF